MPRSLYRLQAQLKSPIITRRASISITTIRTFSGVRSRMSDLSVELTAPNGRKYTQPTGIFINNEFVKSKSGEKITSINPTFVVLYFAL